MMKPPDLIDYWVFEDGKADVEGFQLTEAEVGRAVWTCGRRLEDERKRGLSPYMRSTLWYMDYVDDSSGKFDDPTS